ncbi:MAG TPA: helix-turn-helix transcriptional regulator [Pseudonocardiaceae bacterium]|nr:helix-turn-helix transcriptional regulator [Pseudonocardiaceae bacterium]
MGVVDVDGTLAQLGRWGWRFVAYRDEVAPDPLVAHYLMRHQVDVLIIGADGRCGAYRARVWQDQDPVAVTAVTWSVTGDIQHVLQCLLALPPVDQSWPDVAVPQCIRALLPDPSVHQEVSGERSTVRSVARSDPHVHPAPDPVAAPRSAPASLAHPSMYPEVAQGHPLMDGEDPWVSGKIDRATEEAIGKAVGDLLRRARQASGLKLVELADSCGVSQSVLCRVELARRTPGINFLLTVCSRLGIRLSDVFRAAEDAAVPLPAAPRDGRFHDLLGR